MNNLTPLPGVRRTDRAYDVHTSNNNSDRHAVPVFHISRTSQHNQDNRGSGVHDPRRIREVRAPSGHHIIPNCPAQPHSRQVYIHRGDNRRNYNPRSREIFRQASPRTTFQTSAEFPQPVENPRSSSALSKLKKEVYNPTTKRQSTKLSSYNRDNNSELREEENDEGKRCAICLEDFEAEDEVMITPCNHMFHEECIVPWLTSNDQCPVCRFVISDRGRENHLFQNRNYNNIATLESSGMIAGELLSILRAMEEAFHLGDGIH